MTLDTEFTFGKYSGSTPRELLRQKKGLYLMWCLSNLKGFHIEPVAVEDAIKLKYTSQYIRMQKYNQMRL
jgi:hypothetical protein